MALGVAPAAARATVSSTTITTWTSSQSGTPPNATYLISDDNVPTRLTVSGRAQGTAGDLVDIVCYHGSPSQSTILAQHLSVGNDGSFSTGSPAPTLKNTIDGHACRLRAVPSGHESTGDVSQFAGPDIAVSQVGIPSASLGGHPYDFYAIGTTLSAFAGWNSAGSCGPHIALLDSSFGIGDSALDCVGSLLGSNLPANPPPAPQPTRSEVQIDGHDAYDAASAQAVFGGTEDPNQLPRITPTNLSFDPTDGVLGSQSPEAWVVCAHPVAYPPTFGDCPQFATAGVSLQRNIATSDGGQVVTMTDTWSSTDGQAHSLDLLYDDFVGLHSSSAQRGYELPGQSGFAAYGAGAALPAPAPAVPGSILVRSNLGAADGDPSQAAGAITFSTPPSAFTFASNQELEEHRVLAIPAGGSASVSYIYSTAYSVAQVQALAFAAQDRFQAPAIAITSPADGSTTTNPVATVTGTASAGSGVSSVTVSGQTVPVQGATWSAMVQLSPGLNTITALATDGAGATVEAQLTVGYAAPSPAPGPGPGPGPEPPPSPGCKVPRIEGMKLPAAERALRRAHCRVGRIKHERSKKVGPGRVVATSPGRGRRKVAGGKVELFVSSGP